MPSAPAGRAPAAGYGEPGSSYGGATPPQGETQGETPGGFAGQVRQGGHGESGQAYSGTWTPAPTGAPSEPAGPAPGIDYTAAASAFGGPFGSPSYGGGGTGPSGGPAGEAAGGGYGAGGLSYGDTRAGLPGGAVAAAGLGPGAGYGDAGQPYGDGRAPIQGGAPAGSPEQGPTWAAGGPGAGDVPPGTSDGRYQAAPGGVHHGAAGPQYRDAQPAAAREDAPGGADTIALRVGGPGSQAEGPGPGSSDTLTLRAVSPPGSPPPGAPEPGGRAARRRAAAAAQGRRGGGGRRRRAPEQVKETPGLIAVRVVGELFITLGVVMLLFVAYQLWWTNVAADDFAHGQTSKLEKQWGGAGGKGSASGGSGAAYPSSFSPGTVFAIIYIPKLDVEAPIAEGTDKASILDKGEVGHYTGALETAFPWDKAGNFALAGHRNTHGEPFRYINKLVPGDQVIVETAHDYYTYDITSTLPQTSPEDIGVISPVPKESGFTKPGRYITLTTCTPEFTSEYRLIVWGKLVDDRPRSEGAPKALSGG